MRKTSPAGRKVSRRVRKVRPQPRSPQAASPSGLTQCDSLIAAIKGLDRVLAMAEERTQASAKRAGSYLVIVRKGLDEHIALTEASDGLLPHVERDQPRLRNWAGKLRREHRTLAQQLAVLESAHRRSKGRLTPGLSQKAAELLAALRSHQEQGAEITFEAYVSDVGLPG
jgi:hypothetical protein